MTRRPRRGQIRTVEGSSSRRVLVYSGNMFNDLPDVPYVLTMEISTRRAPMDLELPDGLRVAYTRLDHVPKAALGEIVGEVAPELLAKINTRLFMVLTTQ